MSCDCLEIRRSNPAVLYLIFPRPRFDNLSPDHPPSPDHRRDHSLSPDHPCDQDLTTCPPITPRPPITVATTACPPITRDQDLTCPPITPSPDHRRDHSLSPITAPITATTASPPITSVGEHRPTEASCRGDGVFLDRVLVVNIAPRRQAARWRGGGAGRDCVCGAGRDCVLVVNFYCFPNRCLSSTIRACPDRDLFTTRSNR